jgi:selenocysteine lyase/cysteine desulfurase
LSYAYKPGAARFEFLEANVANRLGMGAAIDVTLDVGIGLIESRCDRLGRLLRKRLGGVPGIKVYHDRGALIQPQCGVERANIATVKATLEEYNERC